VRRMSVEARVYLARAVAVVIAPWIFLWGILRGLRDWALGLWDVAVDLPDYIRAATADDINTARLLFSKGLINYNKTREKEKEKNERTDDEVLRAEADGR